MHCVIRYSLGVRLLVSVLRGREKEGCHVGGVCRSVGGGGGGCRGGAAGERIGVGGVSRATPLQKPYSRHKFYER